jgi:hypothetical protein
MKNAGLLLGFVPLIVYGVLASVTSMTLALAAATVTTIVIGWTDLRKGMILSWANLVMFGCGFITIGVLGIAWVTPYMGVLIYAALAAFTFGSILVGMPFTLQYARGMVDEALWKNPFFIQVNVLMTGVWGGIFSVNLGLSAIMIITPGSIGRVVQVITYIVLVVGIIFTIWYPEHIRKKYPPAPVHNAT